ncbi:MAG TPA: cyclase family protein [Acidimicrobiales bacterium]
MGTDLPPYDELPVRPGLPPGSSWAVWGDHDVLGCLNLLTATAVRAGLDSVRDGTVFPLGLELELPGPPLFGRSAFRHDVVGFEAAHDESLSDWNTQSSSQWDGFRHVGHPHYGFYGGVADEDHGVHHWARRGIVGRAVVCDVARYRAVDGRPIDCATNDAITPADVEGALAAQRVEVEPGDILLLHTGWVEWYRGLDGEARQDLAGSLRCPGLVPGTASARLLWDLHIAAIAADNPAVELWPVGSNLSREERQAARADPDRAHEVFLHHSLLPLLGLPLGELWDLGPLAEACAGDDRWTCLLTSAPLNLAAGVASPPNALAIR